MAKEKQVPVTPGMYGHVSHGIGGEVARGHAGTNIARDGAPKRVHAVNPHPGMTTRSRSGDAYGGDHKSALDSLSGQVVVPGQIQDWPYTGAVTQAGHPLAKAPASKNLKPVAPSFGQRSRTDRGAHAPDLGEAILRQAFTARGVDDADRAAHGRHKDGSK